MPPSPVPEPYGIYPLTLFDDMSTESCIIMGWLVEGILDLNLLAAALDRLLSKWPSLAGRFEPTAGTKVRYVQTSRLFPIRPAVSENQI